MDGDGSICLLGAVPKKDTAAFLSVSARLSGKL